MSEGMDADTARRVADKARNLGLLAAVASETTDYRPANSQHPVTVRAFIGLEWVVIRDEEAMDAIARIVHP